MLRQVFLLVCAAALALGDGRPSKKNTFQKQSKFPSVASYHSPPPAAAPVHGAPAPSPYSFGYEAEGSARQESADASGKVTGSYKVFNEDGTVRVVNYVADEQGFRADVDTNEPGTKSSSPSNVAFKSTFVEPAPPTNDARLEQKPAQFSMDGGAYSYNYEAQLEDGGSIARSESADGSGSVSGRYSMSVADGRRRQVDYSAGSQGFRATIDTNEHAAPPHSSSRQQINSYSLMPERQEPIREPYSFSYDAQMEDGSSSRSESSDGSGRVVGSYSLSTADGRQRTINYEADHAGFRAKVNTNEFGTQSNSPADAEFHSSAEAAPVLQQSPLAAFRPQVPGSQLKSQDDQQSAGAYAFNYLSELEDGTSSRSESADGSGKVVGSYSLSVDDGRKRTVDYLADQGGFRASVSTNEHGTKSDSPANVQFYSSVPQAPMQKPAKQTPLSQQVEPHQPSPYAFNYEAEAAGGSSARSEASDASGTVTGSYTVRNEDGSVRVVEYIADENGFRANVKTNEPGTKSDHPANVMMKSETPAVRPQRTQQQQVSKANFPARSSTRKPNMISQMSIEPWRR